MTRNEIHLHVEAGAWHATQYGPRALEIFDLFGTVTIPCAFTSAAPFELVAREIARLNPGHMVQKANP